MLSLKWGELTKEEYSMNLEMVDLLFDFVSLSTYLIRKFTSSKGPFEVAFEALVLGLAVLPVDDNAGWWEEGDAGVGAGDGLATRSPLLLLVT